MPRRKKSQRLKLPNGAGSITLRSDGRWMARYTVREAETGRSLRKCLYGRSEQEARTKLIEALKARQDGTLIVTRGRAKTVAEGATAWLARLFSMAAKGQRSPLTINRYRRIVDHDVVPEIGKRALIRLQPADVEQVMNRIERRGSRPRTVNYARQTMRAMLNFCMRQGWVNRNVAMMTEPRQQEPAPVKPLPPKDLAVLLADALDDQDGRLHIVSVSLGTRLSEVLGLCWDEHVDDLDGSAPQVHIRRSLQWDEERRCFFVREINKTRKSRRDVNIPQLAIEALRRQRLEQRKARLAAGPRWSTEFGDLVFSGPNGEPLKRDGVSARWTNRLKRLQIARTSFHGGTRHGAASLLAAQGVSMIEVSRTLGHSNLATTADLYTDMFDEARKNVAAAMDRALKADEHQ